MSIELNLPPDLAARLAAEADARGVSLEEYALQLLNLAQATKDNPQTGADLVEFWKKEGLIGTRRDIKNAPAHARKIREKAQRRDRS